MLCKNYHSFTGWSLARKSDNVYTWVLIDTAQQFCGSTSYILYTLLSVSPTGLELERTVLTFDKEPKRDFMRANDQCEDEWCYGPLLQFYREWFTVEPL